MSKLSSCLIGTQRLLREALQSLFAKRPAESGSLSIKLAKRIELLGTAVNLEVEMDSPGGAVFINLHENEQTSVAAARPVLKIHGGSLVCLRSKGRRNVVIWNGPRPYAFDPNRIFTEAGSRQTLSRYASLDDASLEAVRRLRGEILDALVSPAMQPVVALHNNSADGYSIIQYKAGGRHAEDAAAVSISPDHAPGDFFVVTDTTWYKRLKRYGFNVVLQSPNVFDDGSLSVWFQQRQLPYINVEACHGRLLVQQAMLCAVARGLKATARRSSMR